LAGFKIVEKFYTNFCIATRLFPDLVEAFNPVGTGSVQKGKGQQLLALLAKLSLPLEDHFELLAQIDRPSLISLIRKALAVVGKFLALEPDEKGFMSAIQNRELLTEFPRRPGVLRATPRFIGRLNMFELTPPRAVRRGRASTPRGIAEVLITGCLSKLR
jgi:hypothetical protein